IKIPLVSRETAPHSTHLDPVALKAHLALIILPAFENLKEPPPEIRVSGCQTRKSLDYLAHHVKIRDYRRRRQLLGWGHVLNGTGPNEVYDASNVQPQLQRCVLIVLSKIGIV